MARILIVDDDTDLVQLLTMVLKEWGHEVASANEPATGQQVCRAFKPEMILLDYHMPGETGAHLYETFRRNEATARTPILFMSAVASGDEVLSEIADADNSRFLPKPVHMPELKSVIEQMLLAAQT